VRHANTLIERKIRRANLQSASALYVPLQHYSNETNLNSTPRRAFDPKKAQPAAAIKCNLSQEAAIKCDQNTLFARSCSCLRLFADYRTYASFPSGDLPPSAINSPGLGDVSEPESKPSSKNLSRNLTGRTFRCLIGRMDEVDQQAIHRVLGGDRDAYGVLMERHFPMIFRLTFRITRNEQDAEEIAQEAFLRAYRKLREFRQTSTFATWVYRIATNCALDLVRRRTHEASWNAAPLFTENGSERFSSRSSAEPEQAILDREAAQLSDRAMNQLTPLERAAFILRHLEEQSIAEIAATLGVTSNSAKQAVFRAVGKLRRILRTDSRAIQPQVKEVP
jgi:RNA polymerase sigma-70 factor (ECF subfamily)